jgi:hypothetical protein
VQIAKSLNNQQINHLAFLIFNIKKKLSLICNSIWFHTFALEILEEKFELIATSLKKC